ncbi:MAG: T9SS type A sorting domain-containing protein [Saprospirales bacterium]|nr:T9SS type A sorting domain-containing protein [Saprospirales bacterium]
MKKKFTTLALATMTFVMLFGHQPTLAAGENPAQVAHKVAFTQENLQRLDVNAPPESTVIFGSDFESGWDGWTDGGLDCARRHSNYSYEGNYSIMLRDESTVASSMTSPTFDASSYDQLAIEFFFYPRSMESGEGFLVQYYDGADWTTVAAYTSGSSFSNGSFYVATVTVSSASYTFPTNANFRFQCDANAKNDWIYIDAVTVTGITNGAMMASEKQQKITQLADPVSRESKSLAVYETDGVSIFPNPATDYLMLQSEDEISAVNVMSLTGSLVKSFQPNSQAVEIDLGELHPGTYLVSIKKANGNIVTKKFVKQ